MDPQTMLMNRFLLGGGGVSMFDLIVALVAAPLATALAAMLVHQLQGLFEHHGDGGAVGRALPKWLRDALRFPTHSHLIIGSKIVEDEKHYYVNCCQRTKALTRHLMAMDTPMHTQLIGQHCNVFGNYWRSDRETTPTYMISDVTNWTEIAPHVSFRCRSFLSVKRGIGGGGGNASNIVDASETTVRRYYYELQSSKLNTAALAEWLDGLTERTEEELKAKERAKGTRYHFVYRGHKQQDSSSGGGGGGGGGNSGGNGGASKSGAAKRGGDEPGEPQFTMSVLSSKTVECFDALDRLYHPHVGRLKRDLAQLRDLAFFRRHGGKRKRGYLMSGPPGTCKTATAAAVAADDGRHILEVPWSRLQTNAQLEDVLNIRCIGGVHFEARELLVLFEEIDRGHEMFGNKEGKDAGADSTAPAAPAAAQEGAAAAAAAAAATDAAATTTTTAASDATAAAAVVTAVTTAMLTATPPKPIYDELNMGVALSRLDGVSNYDGLLIFANTNNADRLPESMKREGRLTHLVFGPMDAGDARRMVADFYSEQHDEKMKEKDSGGEQQQQQPQQQQQSSASLLLDEVGALVDGAWLVGARLSGMCARNETLANMVSELRAAAAARVAAVAEAADEGMVAAAAAADAAAPTKAAD